MSLTLVCLTGVQVFPSSPGIDVGSLGFRLGYALRAIPKEIEMVLKLGDIVTGENYDGSFIGTIIAFDREIAAGRIAVKLQVDVGKTAWFWARRLEKVSPVELDWAVSK